MFEHHRWRRRPVIRRRGDDGGGTAARVARAHGGDGGAASLTWAMTGTRPPTHLTRMPQRALFFVGRLTDSPACIGSGSIRRRSDVESISFP